VAVEADVIYRTREQIAADFMQRFQARVADLYMGEDGNAAILSEVVGEMLEGLYLANQLVRDNIFIQSASVTELQRHGEQFGLPMKLGLFATGQVRIQGAGGTFIPTGSVLAFDPGVGDVIYFDTTQDATLPNPGSPGAPTGTDSPGAGNLGPGTYEYVVTFVTALGETMAGLESTPVVTSGVANHQINLTGISVGGPGTTARRIYRSFNGSAYQLVTTLADNIAVVFTDNVAAGSLGAAPPIESTAERALVNAQAEEVGVDGNADINTITELADVPDGITDVTNPAAFTGGDDPEDMEDYRNRLLSFIRDPKTGSPSDLQDWALEVDGVDEATVFPNENLGTPQNGHVTIRISGPNGSIPSAAVIAAVLDNINAQDMANVTVHVTTFTAVPTNVTVTLTLQSGYALGDVTAAVQQAIKDYINGTPVGGTIYVAGIYDAVYGMTGVATLTVSVPATDQTTTSTQKRTPGTISVS
jgi:uncharacterized phage protein gp47/JayE